MQQPQTTAPAQTAIVLQSGAKTLSISVDIKDIGAVLSHFKDLL